MLYNHILVNVDFICAIIFGRRRSPDTDGLVKFLSDELVHLNDTVCWRTTAQIGALSRGVAGSDDQIIYGSKAAGVWKPVSLASFLHTYNADKGKQVKF